MPTLSNVATEVGENQSPTGIGIKTNVLPENSQKGVSTLCVPNVLDLPMWYVLRVAYGKEAEANQCLIDNGIKTYYPIRKVKRRVNDVVKKITESYIPNIFFAYCSFNDLKGYVYDNTHVATKYVRFYYNKHHDGTLERVTVSEWEMERLRICIESESGNIIVRPGEIEKFRQGVQVRVVDGPFKGFEGVVARYHGQQRVGVVIGKGLLTVTTAYVPAPFLRVIETEKQKTNQ